MADQAHFRDFSKPRERVYFRVDDDEFDCVTALLPDTLQELMNVIQVKGDVNETDRAAAVVARLRDIFKLFLLPESYDMFEARLGNPRKPIDIRQLLDIIQWVVEVYTARPTTPLPNSSQSLPSGDGGTSSMAGAPPAELIHWS